MGVSGVGVTALVNSCNDLRCIALSQVNCDGNDVCNVARRCCHLHTLAVSFNELITDDVLTCVAQYLPHVQQLEFKGCSSITHKGVLTVLKQCKDLTSFTMTSCFSVGDESVPELGDDVSAIEEEIKPLAKLTVLDLSNCYQIKDPLFCISKFCPSLRELNVSSCSLLTDASVLEIARNCSKLAIINILYCFLLTDAALDHLAKFSKRLEMVSINGRRNFTDSAVNRFRQQATACTLSLHR